LGRPRTAEEFNEWFQESGGDPWNYSNPSIRGRLKASCDFLCRTIRREFKGTIVELGAFDGSFTVLLRKAFPLGNIQVIDISEIAIEKAQRRIGPCERVRFHVQDFLEISRARLPIPQNNEVVILMLECLYYLEGREREVCVGTIRREFPKSLVFVSVPVTGGHYFTETGVLQLFRKANYSLHDFKVLNLKLRIPLLVWILRILAQRFSSLRSIIANQVIYAFAPEE
jgi:Methyltransferase domain